MKAELLISWRYLLTKRKEKFISLISVISVLGIAIGVMALIIVIGVMTGFDKDLREKIVGNYSHITLSAYAPIENAEFMSLGMKLIANKHVRGVSPYVQGQVLLKEGNRFFAVGLKGIDPEAEAKVTKIKQYLVSGSVDNLGASGIVIGRELAFYLGVNTGSEVVVYSPFGKQYKMKVAGLFTSGMYDYDMNLAFVDLAAGQDILGLAGKLSAVSIKLDNLDLAQGVRDELSRQLGPSYNLKTWTEANQNFFAALKLEKLTMFIILTLIILVACFNIVSTLIIMVVEKTKDIGILKALGMSAGRIRALFTLQGLIIGISGVMLGAAGGFTLCALLKKYQFIKLPQDIYYLSTLPVAIELWPDVILITGCAVSIVIAATIYPAKKAAGLEPVEALRYE